MKNERQPKTLYKCDRCKDIGLIAIQKGDTTVYQECECVRLEKLNRLWENSGISIDNLNKSFSNFETWNKKSEEMKEKATKYYLQFDQIKRNRRNSIMLCGNPGSGKTHLALAIANNFINKKKLKVIYMPYRDIVTKIKQNMLDEEYYRKTLSKYQTADILLIDDLFKGKVNETDINITFEIVNYRYLNNLPMIISTEYTVDKLLDFDEAIGSRIYEITRDYLVEIEGKVNNYRLLR